MIEANNSKLKSWISVAQNSDFPIQNIPFGVAKTKNGTVVVSRIGDTVIDIHQLAIQNLVKFDATLFKSSFLNDFMLLGKQATRDLRNQLSQLFRDTNTDAQNNSAVKTALLNIADVEMLLPINVGDYTDFYSSEQHAFNVGCLFRDPKNALMPNWKYIPVGYHGRSSSILASGVAIHRPKGQKRPTPEEAPVFGNCNLLDYELETAFFTYQGKPLGDSITTDEADDYIFGMALFNDWSARDIQAWEYVPLGPFLGKNFASHLSCWIVTLDALEPFRVAGPVQDPKVFPYLEYKGNKHIDINLEVLIKPENSEEVSVGKSNYKYMYWNMNQQLAHHTINGCNIRVGDCMGSGTISGPNEGQYGSMLETTWKGTKPVKMLDGTERKFIADYDTVIMRGFAEKDGVRIGFGEVAAKVLPAK